MNHSRHRLWSPDFCSISQSCCHRAILCRRRRDLGDLVAPDALAAAAGPLFRNLRSHLGDEIVLHLHNCPFAIAPPGFLHGGGCGTKGA